MRVLHVADTPVAGSPYRTVAALNAHTDVAARLVVKDPDAYGPRTFPGDLDWRVDRDEALAELERADLVHVHQGCRFGKFDPAFAELAARKPVVRQFHSCPRDDASFVALMNDDTPKLVIAQFQERYYPSARVVPNLVDLDAPPAPAGGPAADALPRVVFCPTAGAGAYEDRWNTKAAPETAAWLARLEAEGLCSVDLVANVPFAECLARKAAADVVVDDLATGSYHLSGLEGLALGKPVLGWLDDRTASVLRELTGAAHLPWVPAPLYEADPVLRALLADAPLRRALGGEARAWMERYYHPAELVWHFARAYRDLLDNPATLREDRLPGPTAGWNAVGLPDAVWRARRDRWLAEREAGGGADAAKYVRLTQSRKPTLRKRLKAAWAAFRRG